MAVEINQVAEVTEYVLTSTDVKALKEADHVSFVHRENDNHEIICTKSLNKPTPWESEKRYYISIDSHIHQTYRDKYTRNQAHTSLHNYDMNWRTITELLKVGDNLKLRWHVDGHTNGYMEKADLHGDYLELQINRIVGKKEKRLSFLVDSSVTPDNAARMIQY